MAHPEALDIAIALQPLYGRKADPDAGLYNRRFFDAKLFDEVGRAHRYGRPLSLLLLDLDAFKAYNDEYGHTAGDVLLARIGALVRADIRTSDIGCRYGGEESAVIATESSVTEAHRLAQRLHGAIGGPQTAGGVRTSVTVSIGIAGFPEHGQDPAQLVQAADRALYRAKAEGRNRIVAA